MSLYESGSEDGSAHWLHLLKLLLCQIRVPFKVRQDGVQYVVGGGTVFIHGTSNGHLIAFLDDALSTSNNLPE